MTSRVSLVRCESYEPDRVLQSIREAVRLSGFDVALFKGKKVLLKPNLLMAHAPARAVTTHPSVVRAAAELLLEWGVKEVVVGDSPGFGNMRKVLRESGIEAALTDLPVTIGQFSEAIPLSNPGGTLREYALAREAHECDLIINLPKLKTHTLMGLTCAVKNLFGLVVGFTKSRYHLETGRDKARFARIITELAYLKKPALSIVDAVVAMDGNGPGSGDPFRMGLILAGTDPVAIDTVATRIIGFSSDQVLSHEAAVSLKLGDIHPEVVGENLESVKVSNFRPAAAGRGFDRMPGLISKPLKEWLAIRPEIDPVQCKLCQECVRMCPPKAMTRQGNLIAIDKKACIRCFCCQEICPEGAITARRNLPGRLLVRLFK